MHSKKVVLAIATYNIQFGINAEQIIISIATLVSNGAQIICLQELINTPDEGFLIDKILKRLGSKWQAAYHVGTEQSRLSIGTGILWNTEVVKLNHTEKILLPKLKKFDIHEHLYYRLISVPSTVLQRRATTCYFTIDSKELRVTSVHLDNVGGPWHRVKQFTYLISELNNYKTIDRDIICGDFNTFDLLRIGYEKKLLRKVMRNEFEDASEHIKWTSDIYNIDFTTSKPFFPWLIKAANIHIRRKLDYIWVKQMEIISCDKLSIPGSDHFPLIATLQ